VFVQAYRTVELECLGSGHEQWHQIVYTEYNVHHTIAGHPKHDI